MNDLLNKQNLDWFWRIIGTANRDREHLRVLLHQLTREEISCFQDIFLELAIELQDEPFRSHVDPAESDDGVEDLSYCVVSAGKSSYLAVLANPQLIQSYVDNDLSVNFDSVAYEVYFRRFGEPLEVM